jgi:asparagine synthase (glutamine-hydrolysing)
MCGIAGSVNIVLKTVQCTRDLYHRGPDQQTMFAENNVQLHHYRLSILDAIGGRQPMHFEHLTIIFNGEIYNHLDVRAKHSLDCKTQSDTETILLAYDKLGPACLDDFDGMFAFSVYDRKKNEIFIARDRAGKKPLYYYSDANMFVFASELNAIGNQLSLQINDKNVHQYLRAGYFFKSATPYQNVWELPAGCYLTVRIDTLETKVANWWNIHPFYQQKSGDDFKTALEKIDAMLHTSIKRRVESSDLEVGSFLSGGIDSGIVSAIAKQYNTSLKTFTVSFPGEYDEAPLARLVADRYQTSHHEIEIGFDHLLSDVERILQNYGEPFFDSSAIPSYYVSREAKKYLTVILNGDGGDELFGGYRRYLPFSRYDFFKSAAIVRRTSSMLYNILPSSHDKKTKYNYLVRLVDFARKSGLHIYMSSTLDIFEGMEKNLYGDDSVLEALKEDFDTINGSGITGLRKMLNLDFNHLLSCNLLVKMDIATMAHSLEGRSPLLSKEILEYVPTLSDRYKLAGSQTKFILRSLAEKYLPHQLINQPKRGFEIPLKDWIDDELKDLIASYILDSNAYCRNFVKPAFIHDLWKGQVNTGDEKRAKMIWSLFALEVWYRKCYLKK